MEELGLNWVDKIKLKVFGKKYYQAKLLPLMTFKRYGFEKFYSKSQIMYSAQALGYTEYYDENKALALLGKPEESVSTEIYCATRKEFGLQNEGALEVLKVYGKIEKHSSDPFGSNQASETTGGVD